MALSCVTHSTTVPYNSLCLHFLFLLFLKFLVLFDCGERGREGERERERERERVRERERERGRERKRGKVRELGMEQ